MPRGGNNLIFRDPFEIPRPSLTSLPFMKGQKSQTQSQGHKLILSLFHNNTSNGAWFHSLIILILDSC